MNPKRFFAGSSENEFQRITFSFRMEVALLTGNHPLPPPCKGGKWFPFSLERGGGWFLP
jgi:hypothetical protein